MKISFRLLALWVVCGMAFSVQAQTGHAIVSGFDTTRDVKNDDGTWTAPNGCTAADDGAAETCAGTKVDLGFTVNFFGLSFSQLYINTNGNVTFDSPLAAYTPFNLTSTNRQIIAPFFADVDTRNSVSGTTTFGKGTFGGRSAFGVNWVNVGYYYQRADKRNSFQLILVDRSDTGTGNFDIIFNYDTIQWETGEATSSGGVDGLGGRAARAGYSNGTGVSGTALELRGSSTAGAFLDSNSSTGLIHGSLNSDILGRYVFFARNGQIISGGLGITGPCPVPAGFQGIAYSGFSVSINGGTPPYTITSVLPPGLTFDTATSTVRGTPTASGESQISISVTDSAPGVLQQTREFTCTISIASSPPPLKVAGPCLVGVQNRPYWTQLSITGGVGPYSISYLGPAWLAPSPSAPSPGVYSYSLAGTPPSPGTFPVSVTVKDSGGAAGSYSCNIPITPSISITSACPPSSIRAEEAFSYQFNSLGGQATPAWSIIRGQLPSGLTLTSTGRIFGTPNSTPASATFTISVYSGDVSDEKTCSIAITPPLLRVTSGCPSNTGAVGALYGPYPLTASGGLGNASYRFSTTGNFPEGLTISNNAITGRPQRTGAYTFNIQAASGAQTATSGPCTVTIGAAPPEIVGNCPASLQQAGVPVTTTFTPSGGQPPYSFVFTGPSWMSQSNGAVIGIPPASAEGSNVSFTLAVSDTSGAANSRTCTFAVGPPPANPTIIGTCPTRGQALGSAISVPLLAAGGRAPYSWVYNGGVPGLVLQSQAGQSNSLSGNLQNEGEFSFTVNLADSAGVQAQPLTCGLQVAAPPGSLLQLTTGSISSDLLAPVPVMAVLPQPATSEVNGTVRLAFTSVSSLPTDNPEATLSNGYEVPFKIPAGSTSASLGNVQRGTVAGIIRLQVAGWNASLDIPVPAAPPVFSFAVADSTGGVEVVLKGYSTTRDITGGRITIQPKNGAAVTVDLAGIELPRVFADYYSKVRTGTFDNVRVSVPVEGGKAAIESVTVELRNSAGSAEVKQ